MKNIVQIILIIIFISPQFTNAQNWVLQPNQSQLNWTGKAAFSAYALSGTIQLKTADIIIEKETIQSGNFVFDTKTIDSENKDLTKHLKSKDFFEVKKYKTATFVLDNMEADEGGQQTATGQLTIKDKTKPIAFAIQKEWQGNQLIIKGKAIVNRTEFGITFNSPSFFEKLKDQAIADDFELVFELIFVKA